MAVPKTGGYDQAVAVNDGGPAWDFDGRSWSNGKNAAAVYKDCAFFDGRFRWGEINLCANQGQVGCVAMERRKKNQN